MPKLCVFNMQHTVPTYAIAEATGGPWQIWVMDADGSNQTNLSNNSAIEVEPAW